MMIHLVLTYLMIYVKQTFIFTGSEKVIKISIMATRKKKFRQFGFSDPYMVEHLSKSLNPATGVGFGIPIFQTSTQTPPAIRAEILSRPGKSQPRRLGIWRIRVLNCNDFGGVL